MQSDNGDGLGRTLTLEAYADTFVPGARRSEDDLAIAGAASGPGAVEAGAVQLLETPATGVTEGLTSLVHALNEHAGAYATERGLVVPADIPPFVALSFADRTALVRGLIAPDHPEKDIWILVALFCFMAFDKAPMIWSTKSALIVAMSRHKTTESWRTPVALPSGVPASISRQAGSFAIVRFLVTSATSKVRKVWLYASACTTTTGRFLPRPPEG